MEKLKIKISEIEGMSIKIPTEFTGYTFKTFYEQMIAIGKTMPSNPLNIGANLTPERFKMPHWQDEEECLTLLGVYKNDGKDAAAKWIEKNKGWKLENFEIKKLSLLMVGLKQKYKEEFEKRYGK